MRRLAKVCTLVLIGLSLMLAAQAKTSPLLPHNWLDRNFRHLAIADPDDFSFAVFGDSRNCQGRFDLLLDALNHDRSLAFALHLGDMVHHADSGQYSIFFEALQNLRLPLLTVIGNHEIAPDAVAGRKYYGRIFGPGIKPFNYAFQFGQYYFIVIDDADNKKLSPNQLAWLAAELEKSQACRYRLVFLHIPLYDPRPAHAECLPPAASLELLDLFTRYGVTQIFTGHMHAFVQGNWAGIPYIITGGAGAPLAGKKLPGAFYHYVKVHALASGPEFEVVKYYP
jgi:serine/threonine-protein phosphatase CPPED1